MARNIEVLRNYFLGKDPQLKETMADNSLRLIGIPGRHFVLRPELIKGLRDLRKHVDDKDKELQDALDALTQSVEEDLEELRTRDELTQDTRIYELNTGVYRAITPEIKLYYKNGSSVTNHNELILIKEDNSYLIFSTKPDTDHPQVTYGIADANTGWRKQFLVENLEQSTNKTSTISSSSTSDEYPSALAVYNALQNYYTKDEVNQLISVIPQFDIEVVQTLPVQDISETTIYLVPSQDPQTANSYDEFIYVNDAWEQIGSTAIDLSNYYTKTEVDGMIPTQTSQLTNNGDGVTNPFVNKYAKTNMPNGGIYLELGDQAFLISNGQKLTNRLLDTRDIAAMEVITNKVTSISSSSTDTQYPSAKCVYDVLQSTGIKSIRTNKNMWEIDDGVYIVGQGVNFQLKQNSPSDFINTATKTALLVIQNTSSSLTAFSLWDGDWLYNGTCNKTFNTYSLNYADLSTVESTTNKVTSISSSSTDTQYPSAKCVYDAIQNAREIEELTSTTINIWELQAGFYKIKVPSGFSTQVYYKSTNPKTLYYDTYLIVTDTLDTDADDMKYFYLFLQPYQLVDVGETSYEGFSDFVVGWSEKWGNNQIKGAAKTIKLGNVQFKSNLVTSISASSTDTQYPSAKCVYDALQNAGRGITHLTVDSNIWQLDEGVYMPPLNGYLYYDPNDNTKRINIIYEGLLVIDKSVADTVKYALYMGKRIATGTIDMLMGISTIEAVQCQTTSNLVTSMSSSSTDTQYPSAKCVYDALQNAGGPTITYGTTDLTPGVSPLADGEFYFVYE